jgi:hypothetical protein
MESGMPPPKRQVSLWHESFYECVMDRAPPSFEVQAEVLLSLRPRRADLLLLRRKGEPRRDDQARILRGLWPRLSDATLVEFKSPSRGLRRSELIGLLSYGLQYHQGNLDTCPHRSGLTLVLVVPCANPALDADLAAIDCHLMPLGDGYAEVVGFTYTTYVVFADDVAEAEHDDFLRIFSHHPVRTLEARHWLEHWIVEKQAMPDARQQEGYDEMLEKFVKAVPLEDILRHVEPEDILRHVKIEDILPALPVEVLRGFSEDYLRSLPPHVQQMIRQRLGGVGA